MPIRPILALALICCCALPASAATDRRGDGNIAAGHQAMQSQDVLAAQLQFERAIVANPKNPQGYLLLGQVHRRLGNVDKALKYFALALDLDPGLLTVLRLRGEVQLDAGRLAAAEQDLAKLGTKCQFACPEFQDLRKAVVEYKAR